MRKEVFGEDKDEGNVDEKSTWLVQALAGNQRLGPCSSDFLVNSLRAPTGIAAIRFECRS
jgi:hypothetical protein